MRTIEYTNRFKRDFKRELKGRYKAILETSFPEIINQLASDTELAEKYRDHALTGEWKDHRDCNIKPDLVLLYRKPDGNRLQIVRIGSYSELGF